MKNKLNFWIKNNIYVFLAFYYDNLPFNIFPDFHQKKKKIAEKIKLTWRILIVTNINKKLIKKWVKILINNNEIAKSNFDYKF